MLSMKEALEQSRVSVAPGEIVKGRIIEIRPKEALIDIGYKSEGVIPLAEFDDPSQLKVGDEVDVLVERLENKDGMVVLSYEKAKFKRNWERILQIAN
ncbi:MAG: S1 RNA-binding domain-containing protein, partial [Verrucomicrobiia bacterium]